MLVNAAPEVRAEALPYLRLMFVFSIGMFLFFMLGGAFRSAGDARTPLPRPRAHGAEHGTERGVDPRVSVPFPRMGTQARQSVRSSRARSGRVFVLWGDLHRSTASVHFSRREPWRHRLDDRSFAVSLRSANGFQGIAMNIGGLLMLRFIGSLQRSAEAQAAYAVVLHGVVFPDHMDIRGADGRSGRVGRPESGRGTPGPHDPGSGGGGEDWRDRRRIDRDAVRPDPGAASGPLRPDRPHRRSG